MSGWLMYLEAPKAIGCCTEHIANPVKRGELRSVELGRCRVVPIEELQRLLVRRVEAGDLRKGKAKGPEIRPLALSVNHMLVTYAHYYAASETTEVLDNANR